VQGSYPNEELPPFHRAVFRIRAAAADAGAGLSRRVPARPRDRLDLPPEHIAAARAAGVKFSIDTDAHSLVDLTNMRYGVAAARFGGLSSDDVINAWPLDPLEEFLAKGRLCLRLLASSITSGGGRSNGRGQWRRSHEESR
jgi:histidinol phosphatase-like PHP family hydrolase